MMKFFYILLLCFSITLATPRKQNTNAVTPLSDNAMLYLKSLPLKFDEMLSKFNKDLRELVKDDFPAQAILAELHKSPYLEYSKRFTDSGYAKTLMREAKKYDSLLFRFFKNNPVELLKDLAREHPSIKGDLCTSPAIKLLFERFSRVTWDLVQKAEKLTNFDFIHDTLSPVISAHTPTDSELEVFNVYEKFKVPVEPIGLDAFVRELTMRKYFVDNGLLK